MRRRTLIASASAALAAPALRPAAAQPAPTRAETELVVWDARNGLVKVNPVAAWSFDDLIDYATVHEVPVNPLIATGYPSIGCAPCTRPVAPGEDPRSGRWAGLTKTECGLHV